jgi:hypothetical protein
MEIDPREGRSARYMSFSSDDLPAPEGPVNRWKAPFSSVKEMSRQDFRPQAISHPDILESNHRLILSVNGLGAGRLVCARLRAQRRYVRKPGIDAGIGLE